MGLTLKDLETDIDSWHGFEEDVDEPFVDVVLEIGFFDPHPGPVAKPTSSLPWQFLKNTKMVKIFRKLELSFRFIFDVNLLMHKW